jgi:hypothetical protein
MDISSSYWGFFPLDKNSLYGIARRGEVDESIIVDKT